MLPAENRLKKNSDFGKIAREGKILRGDSLVLKHAENNEKQSRFGIVVSQKVSKKAVVRNKVKRRIRELLKKFLPEIVSGRDIVFFAKTNIAGKKFQEIKKEIEEMIEKAKLKKNG